MKRTAAAGVIVLVLAYLLTPTTKAQTAAMTIEFTNATDAGPTERIVVFVGTTACASISIDPSSPPVALLGTTSQPAACGTQGAEITFLQFRHAEQQLELFTRSTFDAGGSFELINWAPQPPGSLLPSYMQAFVDAGAVIRPADSGNAGLEGTRTSLPSAILVLATILVLAAARRLTRAHPTEDPTPTAR